ncbi:MAG: hydroxymethylglutaryl-CoA reductase [Planctomycetota bacterium]
MVTDYRRVAEHLRGLLNNCTMDALAERFLPSDQAMSTRLSGSGQVDAASLDRRWDLLAKNLERTLGQAREELCDPRTRARLDRYQANIENCIGTAELPVGLAGPLRVCGVHARGDYYVPLATTEAALVASCTRGAQAVSLSGGCRCAVVRRGLSRAPGFVFECLADAGRFALWVTEHIDALRQSAESTTRHGKLIDIRVHLEGRHVHLICEYTTGDAAGQNMVTLATDALCQHLLAHCPTQPTRWFVEANMSGDKKASAISFIGVRGRKVVAEAVIPKQVVERRLGTDAESMETYWRVSSLGAVSSGAMGVQGHVANVLAGMYIACGQDAACVAESSVGITRMEARPGQDLYVSVTLPAVVVGTVGGGTGLPSAQACLALLGLPEADPADALAEIVAATALAGELSIVAALAAGDFTQAHRALARDRAEPADTSEEAGTTETADGAAQPGD